MKIYLFNPEHDMALANFSPFYKCAAEIIRMRSDLSGLPAWFAEKGDGVYVSSDAYADCFAAQCIRKEVLPYGRCLSEADVNSLLYKTHHSTETMGVVEGFIPWGWDPALVHTLSSTFSCAELLPNPEQLDRVRDLSGRHHVMDVLRDFTDFDGVCGKAVRCTSVGDVKAFMETSEEVILKAPWSGSGRGLSKTSQATWTMNLEGWVARIIRTQGFIMAEPLYNKVCDFAMEFRMNDRSELSFAGYSLFETDSHGNYKQNVLTSNEEIVRSLTRFVSLELLNKVKNQLLCSLQRVLGEGYEGYFGVDMMICERNGAYVVHPCVEINLRMNMGVVARLLFDRYVSGASKGFYVVEHYGNDHEAVAQDAQLREQHPQLVKDGRMLSGYFPLTPVDPNTRYQCYILLTAKD